MAAKKTVMFSGKAYSLDELDDLVALQNVLVPEKFPLKKRDGVRLFTNLQAMLVVELSKHFAHNFKNIVTVAIEQADAGDGSKVPLSFKVELDFSAMNVAAFAKPGMDFTRKYGTKGTPKSHDINQGDFLSPDGLEVALDTKILDEEMAPEPDAAPPEEGKDEVPKKEKKSKKEKDETAKPKKAGKKNENPAE